MDQWDVTLLNGHVESIATRWFNDFHDKLNHNNHFGFTRRLCCPSINNFPTSEPSGCESVPITIPAMTLWSCDDEYRLDALSPRIQNYRHRYWCRIAAVVYRAPADPHPGPLYPTFFVSTPAPRTDPCAHPPDPAPARHADGVDRCSGRTAMDGRTAPHHPAADHRRIYLARHTRCAGGAEGRHPPPPG